MVRPRAAITARARAFSSCRTLPGQGRSWMVSEGLGGERELAPAVPPLHATEDVLGQWRDVLGAVAERRDDDPGDVEAVVQVLAEPAGGDLLGQVAVGGRDDAGVGAEGLGPADALELPLLEDAEDLGLGRLRQLAHLVEEDRAASGTLEPAGLLAIGAGEGAALVAEELALDQALGQGPAIDPDEGTGGAVRVAVQARRRPAPCRCHSRRRSGRRHRSRRPGRSP